MSKLVLSIIDAAKELSGFHAMIRNAAHEAESFVFRTLDITWDIDVVVTTRMPDFLIKEDGVGGRTYASDFIIIDLDTRKFDGDLLSEMITHELCHAARWGKNPEWAHTLFDNIISEGLATAFEAEFSNNSQNQRQSFFLQTILEHAKNKNEKILRTLRPSLNEKNFSYKELFYSGNEELPRWSGYSAGFYLVQEYSKLRQKNISEIITDRYDDFRKTLANFLPDKK